MTAGDPSPAVDSKETKRATLRRATHDAKDVLADLASRLGPVDGDAAAAVERARCALFEAWTILCTPPANDEDDHDH